MKNNVALAYVTNKNLRNLCNPDSDLDSLD